MPSQEFNGKCKIERTLLVTTCDANLTLAVVGYPFFMVPPRLTFEYSSIQAGRKALAFLVIGSLHIKKS